MAGVEHPRGLLEEVTQSEAEARVGDEATPGVLGSVLALPARESQFSSPKAPRKTNLTVCKRERRARVSGEL